MSNSVGATLRESGPATTAAPRAIGGPVLSVGGLCHAFGSQKIFDNLSLELKRGEVVLLRGPNGSGKTTLLNILTGHLEPEAGTVRVRSGRDWQTVAFGRRRRPWPAVSPEYMARLGIARTWQENRLFPKHTLQENLALATANQLGENPLWAILRRRAMREQDRAILDTSVALLARAGLAERSGATPERISLGQAKRVAIMRALQSGARILLLDEPLAGLDTDGIQMLLRFLSELADRHVSVVIVEHVLNIPVVLDFATSVWTLQAGRLTSELPTTVRALSEPGFDVREWVSAFAGTEGEIVEQQLPRGARLISAIPRKLKSSGPVLEVEGLIARRGSQLLFVEGPEPGLSFSIRNGEVALLTAPNGWGKTTLLETIAGVAPARSGVVRFEGKPLGSLAAWERARLGLALQRSRDNTFPDLTVAEGLRLARVSETPAPLAHLTHRRARDLSGGERQRLALTCALQGARVALLDEPFLALDMSALDQLRATVASLPTLHGCLLAVPAANSSSSSRRA